MKKVSATIIKVAEWILGMAGVATILIETYSVFCRNITHWSTPWVDEVLRLMFVLMVFIGAAIAFRTDELISLTMIEDSFKEKGKKVPFNVLKLIQYVSALGVGIILVLQWFETMMGQMTSGEATAITGYKVWTRSCGILIGCILLVIIGVVKVVGVIKAFKSKE